MLSHEDFVGRVWRRGSFSTEGESYRAIEATLGVWSEQLDAHTAKRVAAELPSPLGIIVHHAPHLRELGLTTLYQRVGEAPGLAEEHVAVVFQVLAESITTKTLRHLRDHEPAEFARLLKGPRRAGSPPPLPADCVPQHG